MRRLTASCSLLTAVFHHAAAPALQRSPHSGTART